MGKVQCLSMYDNYKIFTKWCYTQVAADPYSKFSLVISLVTSAQITVVVSKLSPSL